jgi:hypothetical protein
MRNTIRVTVRNSYLHRITEEFICSGVDVSDLEEMEYCAEECVGQYLDMHTDIINRLDVDFETLAEACYYSIEEVSNV